MVDLQGGGDREGSSDLQKVANGFQGKENKVKKPAIRKVKNLFYQGVHLFKIRGLPVVFGDLTQYFFPVSRPVVAELPVTHIQEVGIFLQGKAEIFVPAVLEHPVAVKPPFL
ncbi:hypothetical protein D9M69_622680 [compost metagenome]